MQNTPKNLKYFPAQENCIKPKSKKQDEHPCLNFGVGSPRVIPLIYNQTKLGIIVPETTRNTGSDSHKSKPFLSQSTGIKHKNTD